jgi:hypothetical protein
MRLSRHAANKAQKRPRDGDSDDDDDGEAPAGDAPAGDAPAAARGALSFVSLCAEPLQALVAPPFSAPRMPLKQVTSGYSNRLYLGTS